jgi:hypothetical protein
MEAGDSYPPAALYPCAPLQDQIPNSERAAKIAEYADMEEDMGAATKILA